uniref:Uncharacterized protein n=1 Tax=Plectus sambesii TaxID=2011161 RepID=A0A914WDL5_9BILA
MIAEITNNGSAPVLIRSRTSLAFFGSPTTHSMSRARAHGVHRRVASENHAVSVDTMAITALPLDCWLRCHARPINMRDMGVYSCALLCHLKSAITGAK